MCKIYSFENLRCTCSWTSRAKTGRFFLVVIVEFLSRNRWMLLPELCPIRKSRINTQSRHWTGSGSDFRAIVRNISATFHNRRWVHHATVREILGGLLGEIIRLCSRLPPPPARGERAPESQQQPPGPLSPPGRRPPWPSGREIKSDLMESVMRGGFRGNRYRETGRGDVTKWTEAYASINGQTHMPP
jgi:hypothetical protein